MSKSTLEQVKEFHEKFGHPVRQDPFLGDQKLVDLRLNLIHEEFLELSEAVSSQDHLASLDALLDLQYVLDGAFLALGFHQVKEAAFAEVHRSNMSKLGEDGKPVYREDGKILKGPNWSPPNLAQFLDQEAKVA